MSKVLDLSKKVAELVEEYPEIKPIMVELGFKDITSPAALKFMGRIMTIPKGSVVKGIPMEKIVKAFEDAGFTVVGYEGAQGDAGTAEAASGNSDMENAHDAQNKAGADQQPGSTAADEQPDNTAAGDLVSEMAQTAEKLDGEGSDTERIQQLKALIKRVGDGEDIESVRADFVKEFKSVSVHEIADAEQSLIRDGMPVTEVQKLCDLHSALFHGMTEEEVWEQEERENAARGNEIPEGHPIDYFHRENAALEKILKKTELDVGFAAAICSDAAGGKGTAGGSNVAGGSDAADGSAAADACRKVSDDFALLKKVRPLYGKKEELIMPPLERYGIDGPSNVMWGVDDEIKQSTSRIAGSLARGIDNGSAAAMFTSLKDEIDKVTKRMEEMIYKEEKILYPMCQENFTDDEWVDVYADIPEMGPVFIDEIPKWAHGEEVLAARKAAAGEDSIGSGKIQFELGSLTVPQLRALFDTLPLDITFIDANDINTFFSNNGKVFSRPKSALGRKVYDCHPARIRPVVEQLISEFKAGTRDSYERWIPMRAVKIMYKAVRDENGKFLGTVEIVQDFSKDKKALRGLK